MLAYLLPCSVVTGKWHLSRNSHAVLAKWRENNGAKMTSRSRQKFPAQMSETKRVNITLPSFCFLIPTDFTQKKFEQLFNFQGPVITECTVVLPSDTVEKESSRDLGRWAGGSLRGEDEGQGLGKGKCVALRMANRRWGRGGGGGGYLVCQLGF